MFRSKKHKIVTITWNKAADVKEIEKLLRVEIFRHTLFSIVGIHNGPGIFHPGTLGDSIDLQAFLWGKDSVQIVKPSDWTGDKELCLDLK